MVDENSPLKSRTTGSAQDPAGLFAGFNRDVCVCSCAITTLNYNLCINSYSMYIITDEVKATRYDAALVGLMLLLGLFCGQLAFGLFAERAGKRQSFYLCCLFIFLGAGLSGCAGNVTTYDYGGILREIAVYRCVVGFGCGGMYPLIATAVRDSVREEKLAIATIAMVFGPLGTLGLILAPLVSAPVALRCSLRIRM